MFAHVFFLCNDQALTLSIHLIVFYWSNCILRVNWAGFVLLQVCSTRSRWMLRMCCYGSDQCCGLILGDRAAFHSLYCIYISLLSCILFIRYPYIKLLIQWLINSFVESLLKVYQLFLSLTERSVCSVLWFQSECLTQSAVCVLRREAMFAFYYR